MAQVLVEIRVLFQGVPPMHRTLTRAVTLLAVIVLLAALNPLRVQAQVIQVYYPPPPPVVTYSVPAPVYVPPPVRVSYSYYPSTSYYPAAVYYPSTTVYSAPAPATYMATTPGVVTTRSYVGFGIFRPWG